MAKKMVTATQGLRFPVTTMVSMPVRQAIERRAQREHVALSVIARRALEHYLQQSASTDA